MVDNFGFLFKCTLAGRTSDSMNVPLIHERAVAWCGIFVLSPFFLDLYVLGDDIDIVGIFHTNHQIHIRNNGDIGTVKYVYAPKYFMLTIPRR